MQMHFSPLYNTHHPLSLPLSASDVGCADAVNPTVETAHYLPGVTVGLPSRPHAPADGPVGVRPPPAAASPHPDRLGGPQPTVVQTVQLPPCSESADSARFSNLEI